MGSKKRPIKSKVQQPSSNLYRMKVHKVGLDERFLTDFYHFVLSMTWFRFFVINTGLYLLMTLFFASLFLVGGDNIINARPGSVWDAFVFTFQTSTTIGYGHLQPANGYADVIVIASTLAGIIFVAITTGLAFARFSRPTNRILFAKQCVVDLFEGQKTLMVRLANARDTHIADATVDMVVVMDEVTAEGVHMQRIRDLKLVRSKSPVFFMSWTVMHVLDELSPLANLTKEEILEKNVRIVVSMSGLDDWSSQVVHANHLYRASELAHGFRYKNILTRNEDGSTTMDYSQFDLVEPVELS